MIKIHSIQTGKVRVKQFQATGARNQISRLWQLFFTHRWSDWHPVYCWLIEHPDGLFLIDTGEVAKVHEKGHLPDTILFRAAVQYDVKREDEVDRQLKKSGYEAGQIQAIYLTHFHSDHMDGLVHFPGARVYASREGFDFAMSTQGEKAGYLRKNLPRWCKPETFDFDDCREAGFGKSKLLMEDGSLVAVPLPGHSPGHTGYIVKTENRRYVFSGDTTHNRRTLQEGIPSVILNNPQSEESVNRLREYARSSDVIVLGSHDPDISEILGTE